MKAIRCFGGVALLTATVTARAELYNVQLNGLAETYSGPGRVGAAGDVWNNPALDKIDGSGYEDATSLATAVELVNHAGVESSVRMWVSALNYVGQTSSTGAGNPVEGLNNSALKFDWNNEEPVPTVTISLSGLSADAPVGLYVFGASSFSGYPLGSTWTLGTANGGGVGNCGHGGDFLEPDGLNLASAAGEGLGWDRVDGTTDANGELTVVVTPVDRDKFGGAGAWWQTYINGFQLQLFSVPTVSGLEDATVVAGDTVTLSPSVIGTPDPTFQWRLNGVDLDGETGPTLTIENISHEMHGSVYSLVATNPAGSATANMTLNVMVPPVVSGLVNRSVSPGSDVTLVATVVGVPDPDLQWYLDGEEIPSATSNTIVIADAQEWDTGTYSIVATNAAGSADLSMELVVSGSAFKPVVEGLSDRTIVAGGNVVFEATVTGLPEPAMQWYENDVVIDGATGSILVMNGVAHSRNGSVFSLTATNSEGTTTASAVVRVLLPPSITSGAENTTTVVGDTTFFSIDVEADPEPEYQWYRNGTAISAIDNPSAATATLAIQNVSADDFGSYHAVVTNPAGEATSDRAELTVHSKMAITSTTPDNGANGVCTDTLLRIGFDKVPLLRGNGKILIFDAANPRGAADTIDLSLNGPKGVQARQIGGEPFNTYPVVIARKSVTIYPHAGTLSRGRTYFVFIEPGVFTDEDGAWFPGIDDPQAWRFTTKSEGPVDQFSLVVAADGSGDFCTVQGALDSLPANNTTPALIEIRDGRYSEIVNVNGRNKVTLRGESRAGTVLEYANNAGIASGGSTHSRMSTKINADEVTIENLTLSNTTPQGGSQAEALMIETDAARFVLNNATVKSRQDTILANVNSSQGYFLNSRIEGNFDYIWGGGNLFFDRCTIHTISGAAGGNVTAARTDFGTSNGGGSWQTPDGTKWSKNGMAFVNCEWTADPDLSGITLAGVNGTPGGQVAWIGCRFSSAYAAPPASLAPAYNFWQHGNTDLSGIPVTFDNMVALADSDERLLAAQSAVTWLYGWQPEIAMEQPVIVNPVVSDEGSFQCSFSGPAGQGYRVWATEDAHASITGGAWALVADGVFGTDPVDFTEATADRNQRFYVVTMP